MSTREYITSHRAVRRIAVVGAAIALVGSVTAISGAAVTISRGLAPSVQPKVDIVGKGLFNCTTVTGEVGYSPDIKAPGATTGHERVSIWFVASNCTALPGQKTTPVPKKVVGSMSFLDNFGTTCPQLSGPILGTGIVNLAYNFPGVPVTMIDPSVAPAVQVKQVGAFWDFLPVPGVTDGSYISPKFNAFFKPNPIAPQNCQKGITSEYIIRGALYSV
jgi:hypothetical protein